MNPAELYTDTLVVSYRYTLIDDAAISVRSRYSALKMHASEFFLFRANKFIKKTPSIIIMMYIPVYTILYYRETRLTGRFESSFWSLSGLPRPSGGHQTKMTDISFVFDLLKLGVDWLNIIKKNIWSNRGPRERRERYFLKLPSFHCLSSRLDSLFWVREVTIFVGNIGLETVS